MVPQTARLRGLIALLVLVLGFAMLAKWAIERSLHYRREREVLFILEVAHWLCHTGRSPDLFDGLDGAGSLEFVHQSGKAPGSPPRG